MQQVIADTLQPHTCASRGTIALSPNVRALSSQHATRGTTRAHSFFSEDDTHAMHAQTTLMDVIAGRKTQGEIRGEILVNGHPKDQKSWARVVGYVEQNDIHSPQVLFSPSPTGLSRIPSSWIHDCCDAQCPLYTVMLELMGLLLLGTTSTGRLEMSGYTLEGSTDPCILFQRAVSEWLVADDQGVAWHSCRCWFGRP